MSLATKFLCTVLISFLFLSASSASRGDGDTLTAYEVLEDYDFPAGLLPKGILSYEPDNSAGQFSVYSNGSCTSSVNSYELKYKLKITGKISTDKLKSLSGIKVEVLSLWPSIVEVIRDDDKLQFSAGIRSADFPVGNFDKSPTCGTRGWKEKGIKPYVPKLSSYSQ